MIILIYLTDIYLLKHIFYVGLYLAMEGGQCVINNKGVSEWVGGKQFPEVASFFLFLS